jgi:hypothetical protein
VETLRVFTRRERLRVFSRSQASRVLVAAGGEDAPAPEAIRPRPFAYRWVTQAYALCPDCHAAMAHGRGEMLDHDRRRALLVMAAFIGVGAVIWAGFAPFTFNWIAAFWRNGAGGR